MLVGRRLRAEARVEPVERASALFGEVLGALAAQLRCHVGGQRRQVRPESAGQRVRRAITAADTLLVRAEAPQHHRAHIGLGVAVCASQGSGHNVRD